MEKPTKNGTGLSAAQLWHYYHRYPFLLAKACLFALVIGGLFFVMRSVEAVLFPLLASLLVAYLLDPAVDWFEERKVSRTVAISIFMVAGVVTSALFVLVLYPTVVRTAAKIVDRLPLLAEVLQSQTLPWLRERGIEIPPTLSLAFDEYGATLQENLPNLVQKITGWVGGIVAGAGGVVASLLNIVMIPLFTFYFLRDFDLMTASLREYIPLGRREVLLDRVQKSDVVIGAWFRGQVEVAGILAGLYAAGLGGLFGFLGIGSVTGIAIGVLTGLLNIVPYFGVLIGIILSTLLVLIDWHGWMGPIGVAIVFTIVQILEGYVITPKIVGEKVGLSPVTVIIVLLLGGELFGLTGVLLAIPVAGVIRVLLPDMLGVYTASPFYTGKLPYDLVTEETPAIGSTADVSEFETNPVTDQAAVEQELVSDDDSAVAKPDALGSQAADSQEAVSPENHGSKPTGD
jgi:predicted PurR-regulated permease PerM